ncbi:DUF927 domain-containing protein [Desulfovirgula thermocuniculi]|uniref:DUF927 domain-containing protein n=1 Tax=Desulfovirgula thermocuniculi TaxID=348842 RepID=UPI00040E025F|nr:DUF927 domain-containing protein [Desulfovirgula thermocuniculi]
MLKQAHIQRLIDKYAIPEKKAEELVHLGVLRTVSAEEIENLVGRSNQEGDGILIKYPTAPDMFAIRLDVPRPRAGGKTQKYDRPSGIPPRLFVPPGLDLDRLEEIWITEGELKALCGWAHGLPVVALAGVWNWRRSVDEDEPIEAAAKMAGPEGKAPDPEALIEDLRREWTGKRIVLIYDSDIDQEHPAWPAFGRLAEQLYALGAGEVKVLTLPAEPPLEGEGEGADKTGLDDFIRRRKARGHDPVAELRELVRRVPEWVPSGGYLFGCTEKVGTLEGLEKFARSRLASGDPVKMVLGAAAYYVAGRQTMLQAALRDLGIRGELAKAVKEDAQAEAERVQARQEWRRPQEREEEGEGGILRARTIAAAFPPAKEVLPPDFPFPDAKRRKAFYDIRGSRVVLVQVEEDREREEEVAPTVVLLTRRLTPLEGAEGNSEIWEVAWWEGGKWEKRQLPADYCFDTGQRKWLIRAGVPVSSATAEQMVTWLNALRVQAVYGGTPLPTARTVDRCGWHTGPGGEPVFVFGREILTLNGTRDQEADAAGSAVEGQDPEEEIVWAGDTWISVMERQVLASFGTGGDPRRHREFLLEMVTRYPQAAFGVGCACAAPLIALLREAPGAKRLDVSGFTVMMGPGISQGRSRHQGKTCWNRIVAGLFGWPEKDPKGRLRFADRTRVALGVLYSTSCDLPVHIEDAHLIIQERKKEAATELDWLLQLTAGGMDRERGAKSGGGRKTRYFRTVAFWTSEVDLTAKIPPGSGSVDRIIKVPPLLPVESDENREEAERIERETLANYGHAGKTYLQYILHRLVRDRQGFLVELGERYDSAVAALRECLPEDPAARHVAGRLAKRVALGLVGLNYLMEALGVGEEDTGKALTTFLRCWSEMVLEGVESLDSLEDRAMQAVADFVAENGEFIQDYYHEEGEKSAKKWIGAKVKVKGEEAIALLEKAFAEAVRREPYNLDPDQALKALWAAGYVVGSTVKKSNGKAVSIPKHRARVGDFRPWCVCILLKFLQDKRDEKEELPPDIHTVF